MTPLVFLDTETTGLCPDIHAPWEVAWTTAVHDGDTLRLIQSRSFIVRISEIIESLASPEALKIGRFAERFVDPVYPEDMLSALQADLSNVSRAADSTAVPHLVGAVPSFDHAMLCQNWLGWPDFGEGLWHYHLVDVEVLAAGKLGIAPPYKMSELLSALGVPLDESRRHTAAGDVDTTVAMYAAVYGLEVIPA